MTDRFLNKVIIIIIIIIIIIATIIFSLNFNKRIVLPTRKTYVNFLMHNYVACKAS